MYGTDPETRFPVPPGASEVAATAEVSTGAPLEAAPATLWLAPAAPLDAGTSVEVVAAAIAHVDPL